MSIDGTEEKEMHCLKGNGVAAAARAVIENGHRHLSSSKKSIMMMTTSLQIWKTVKMKTSYMTLKQKTF